MSVRPVPEGYHSVTPYLIVPDAGAFVDFCARALGAVEKECMRTPDGDVVHAEIQVGDSPLMVGAARPEWPATPTHLYLYVPDADEAYRKAMAEGAESIREPADQSYGDRSGGVKHASGVCFWFGTRIENVSPEEMQRRMAEQA